MPTRKKTTVPTKRALEKKSSSGKAVKLRLERLEIKLPEILGSVEYVYSNHARLSANQFDFRVAFGDLDPTGVLTPKTGVIIPAVTAKGLHIALGKVIEAYEAREGKIAHPTDPVEIEVVADQDEKPA